MKIVENEKMIICAVNNDFFSRIKFIKGFNKELR